MEPQYVLSLTLDEINVILAILGKQPYEVVGDLIPAIRNQVLSQAQESIDNK